jgi:hypothetical protein
VANPVDMTVFNPPKGGWGGRPTLYDPAFCDEIIQLGEQGASITQMAYHCGVTVNTLNTWASSYSEFLTAFTRAKLASQCWWEKAGQHGMLMAGFNGGVYGRSMAARFPHDWTERKATELTGKDGGAITFKRADDLSDDELAAIVKK